MYDTILPFVIDIVKQASSLMSRDHFTVSVKEEHIENIVTSSDVAVQDFLTGKLSLLLPGSGFFCEEEDLNAPSSDYTWIIDPIDGTANYARGIADCCISVGLEYRGEIVLGVVYSPWRNELYSACKGKGAFMNGERIHVSTRPFRQALFCTAMSTYHKEFAQTCSRIIYDVYMGCNDLRRWGSAALELCLLARGDVELYFEMRLQPWDYAGGLLILKEAGGYAASFDGALPSLRRPSLLVAANSRESLSLLEKAVHTHLEYYPEVK